MPKNTDDRFSWKNGDVKFQPKPKRKDNASARTLYAYRNVLNVAAIANWAKDQGLEAQDGLHVTVAYSKTPFDWMKVGGPWMYREEDDDDGRLLVQPGGVRLMELFGPTNTDKPFAKRGSYAVALLFKCATIESRHSDIMYAGGSHEYEGYEPHITIAYVASKIDLKKIEPYRGAIALGPEIFEEIT